MQPIVMAVLLLAGWGIFAYSAYRRGRLLLVGAAEEGHGGRVSERLGAVWTFAITNCACGAIRRPASLTWRSSSAFSCCCCAP